MAVVVLAGLAYLVLDTSESMLYQSDAGGLSKLEYAKCVAASLAYLVLQQQDSVGLATFDSQLRSVVRPGSVLQPKFPAPLGMRGVTMMRNMAACLGLLNVATGGRAMAAHSAYVIWYLRGRDDKGELFLLSDGLGVGYGARPTADGNDAVYLVAQENFPSEFLDSVFPVRVLRYAINPDTGGPGRWRGGCGLIREIEVLAPEASVSMRIDSVEHPTAD